MKTVCRTEFINGGKFYVALPRICEENKVLSRVNKNIPVDERLIGNGADNGRGAGGAL